MAERIWRKGFPAKIKPEIAWEEIERIREERGGILRPEFVVDEARDPEAPLHPQFEWDDAKAAELQRVGVARQMLRAIVVFDADRPEMQTPTYVRVIEEKAEVDASRYVSLEDAFSDERMRMQVLYRALGELESIQRRYRALKELAAVFEALERTRARVIPEHQPAA